LVDCVRAGENPQPCANKIAGSWDEKKKLASFETSDQDASTLDSPSPALTLEADALMPAWRICDRIALRSDVSRQNSPAVRPLDTQQWRHVLLGITAAVRRLPPRARRERLDEGVKARSLHHDPPYLVDYDGTTHPAKPEPAQARTRIRIVQKLRCHRDRGQSQPRAVRKVPRARRSPRQILPGAGMVHVAR